MKSKTQQFLEDTIGWIGVTTIVFAILLIGYLARLPCPMCKTPLGLTLEFIIKHPVSACPNCKTVLDFTVNEDIKKSYNDAMNEIKKIKNQYKGMVKFG